MPHDVTISPAEALRDRLVADAAERARIEDAKFAGKAQQWLRASSIHPCDRHLYYQITLPQGQRPPTTGEKKLLFELGNVVETRVVRLLQDAGYEVERGQEMFELKLRNGVITGHIDGMISGHEIGAVPCPLEVKGYSFAGQKIDRWQDFLDQRQHWLRQVPCQLQVYLLAHNAERGYLLIYEKMSGQLKPVEVDLDLDFAETICQRAERVYAAREAGGPPERCDYDPDLCKECDWAHICQPFIPITEQGIVVIPVLVEACRRWLELEAGGREWKKLDEYIKKMAKEDFDPAWQTVFVGDVAELSIKRGGNVTTTIRKQEESK
jgi:CRISPR/Cas system-associated exonuclease Cas4 (RecB family)